MKFGKLVLLIVSLFLIKIIIIIFPYMKYFKKVKFPRSTDDIPFLTKFKCLKFIENNNLNASKRLIEFICSSNVPKQIKNVRKRSFWNIEDINRYLMKNKEIILQDLNSINLDTEYQDVGNHAYTCEESDYLNKNWKIFNLFKRFHEENKNKCSATKQIVQKIPGFFGCAFFSALKGKAIIPRHKGPYNIKLTCLFGLKNTEDSVFIVNEEEKKWTDNDVIIFDDSSEHEARNGGDKTRIVLIIDIFHPDLDEKEKEILKLLYKKF